MNASNLGAALVTTGHLEEAAVALRKAVAISETLNKWQPQRLDYRSGLGLALHNLCELCQAQGRHGEAVALYRQAIDHQRAVFDRSPRVNQFRRYLSDHYVGLAKSLRALGRAREAAEATRDRVKLWPKEAGRLYDSACEFALCVPIAGNAIRKQSLSDEAMATLNAAVAAGYSDGAWMSRDTDLIPLRDRDDFRRLVLGLMDRAMPADSFAGSR
jgi:tetratricopeptide (TPR) repeat protein